MFLPLSHRPGGEKTLCKLQTTVMVTMGHEKNGYHVKRNITLLNNQKTCSLCYILPYLSYSECPLQWPTSTKMYTYFLQCFKDILWYFVSLTISKRLKPQVDLSTFCRPALSFKRERAALLRETLPVCTKPPRKHKTTWYSSLA